MVELSKNVSQPAIPTKVVVVECHSESRFMGKKNLIRAKREKILRRFTPQNDIFEFIYKSLFCRKEAFLNENETDPSPNEMEFTRLPFIGREIKFWDYFPLFFNTQENRSKLKNNEGRFYKKTANLCKQGFVFLDSFFFEGFFIRGFLRLDEKSN